MRRRPGALRRRQQSGIPEGRRGRRRLHAPEPHHRRRGCAGGREDHAGALSPIQHEPRPCADDEPARIRAHQVRGQRAARDQDQLHQRSRQPVRPARRRHRQRTTRHRLRPAHRPRVHLRRRGLRRIVLPEGRESADPCGPVDRGRPARSERHTRAQRAAEALRSRPGEAALRHRPQRTHVRRLGACRSSRAPTTCARRRR